MYARSVPDAMRFVAPYCNDPKFFEPLVCPVPLVVTHPSQSPACSNGMQSVPAAISVTPVTAIFPDRSSVPAPRFTSDFTIVFVQEGKESVAPDGTVQSIAGYSIVERLSASAFASSKSTSPPLMSLSVPPSAGSEPLP